MQVARKIIEILNHDENVEEAGKEVGGRKKGRFVEVAIEKFLRGFKPEERLLKKALISQIEHSPLYIEPASSQHFGWNRGFVMKLETILRGRWSAWLNILHKQRFDSSTDLIPDCPFSMFDGSEQVKKMLNKCMDYGINSGYRGHDFMEWLGYSLGIAWFEKPKIDDRTWHHWNETFDVSLMLLYPSDYLSTFLIDYSGQSGVGGYYPTPINITMAIMKMLGTGDDIEPRRRCECVFEPCLGAGAMLLPSDSLNLVGADYNLAMVKAASIQAFLYQPWLLYVPHPIIGLHFSEEEMRIHRYYEFDTNSRIYLGDSLLGEYIAPPDIFSESKERVDIFVQPLDLEKNSALKWEKEFMTIPWSEMPSGLKLEVVKAQARNLKFEIMASNPPFGKLNKYTMEQIRKYLETNIVFLARRKAWLDEVSKPPHPHSEEMIGQALKIIEEKTGQLAFF